MNTEAGCHALLQGIFPNQGSNPGLLHCRRSLQTEKPKESPSTRKAQEYWAGSLSLLQGIFPTQESNQGLLYCRWILYQLSYRESPRILEKVAYPFSSGSFWPRNQVGVSCIAGGFFTNRAMREALLEKLWKFSITNIVFKMSSTKHRTEVYSWGKYFLEKTMIENSSF